MDESDVCFLYCHAGQTSELEYRPFIEEGKNWSVQYGFEMSDNDF